MTFVKIHGTILYSSIWAEEPPTRLVWITLLVMADQNGVVSASIGGLAHAARVSRQDCEAALAVFTSPEPDSRDGTTGERIEKVTGGWLVLNHAQYRDKQTDAQIKAAARAKRYRDRQKAVTHNEITPRHDLPPSEPEPEAEPEATTTKRAVADASLDRKTDLLREFFPKGITDSAAKSEIDAWAAGLTEHELLLGLAKAREQKTPEGALISAVQNGYVREWTTK